MGGSLEVLQDHPASDCQPGVFQTLDEETREDILSILIDTSFTVLVSQGSVSLVKGNQVGGGHLPVT